MSRYIDAENILYSSVMIEEDNGNYRKMWIATKEDIDAIPAADVRENVRGEWVHKEIQSDNFIDGVIRLPNCYCSVCGVEVLQECNFCPNCGADMRGEA